MKRIVKVCAGVALVWLATGEQGAQAQPRRPQMTRVRVQGTLRGIRGAVLQMLGENNQPYLVRISQRTRVQVVGPVPVKMLRSGQTIRFAAQVDQQGKVVAPVKKVEIFTVDDLNRVGMEVEQEPQEDKPGRCFMAGRLVRVSKDGEMLVMIPVGRKIQRITAPLDPQAQVHVAVRGHVWLRLVRPGASVVVEGEFPQFNQRLIFAQRVDVTLPKQLPAGPQDRKKRRKD